MLQARSGNGLGNTKTKKEKKKTPELKIPEIICAGKKEVIQGNYENDFKMNCVGIQRVAKKIYC